MTLLLLRVLAIAIALQAPSLALAMTVSEAIDEGANLKDPWGIVADPDGNVFVAGVRSNEVLQLAPDGTVTVSIKSRDDAGHQLYLPQELVSAPDGTLYLTANGSNNVFKRPPGGAWTQILDAAGDGAGHPLQYPTRVAADGAGNAFVCDSNTNTVFRIDAAGVVTVVMDASGDGAGHALGGPAALATDSVGNLYVAGTYSDNVFQVTPSGTVTQILANGPGSALDYPTALAVDAADNVYVVSTSNYLWRIAPGGAVSLVSYVPDAVALAVRADGLVYVAQWNHHSIIGIRQGGPPCLLIDQTGDGVTPFGFASRFAVAPDGDVYASNVSYGDVFKIDDPCTGPSVDMNGHWFVRRPHGGPTEEQNWAQSGFDLIVSDPGTGNPTFYGTIDDRNHIMLTSYATFPPFCAAYNIIGDAAADGFGWAGSFIINATAVGAHCIEYDRYALVADRCGDGSIDPGEECEDGNAVAGDGCDGCKVEPCFACSGLPSVCAPAVRTCVGAAAPGGVSLKMRPAAGGRYASLKWAFAKGAPVGIATLGDPRTTTDYDVCLFDGGGQVLFAARAPAGSDWRTKGAKGFAYKSSAYGYPDGITTLTALSGTKSKVGVRAGGVALTLPALPLPLPVTLQVQASDGGCFALDYSSAGLGQNDASGVSLRADP